MNCCAEDHDEVDALFNDENDVQFLANLCSKRFHELKEADDHTTTLKNDNNEIWGYLSEIGHEKEVLHMSTHVPRLIIHFYNPAFKNCQLLNEHLQVQSDILYTHNFHLISICRNWLESFLRPDSFSLKQLRPPF